MIEDNPYRKFFFLRDDITYLNFGSFGACVKPVFEKYQQFQLELETEPVQFMTVNGNQYLQQSRIALANYIHCDADDLVYVTNPSYGVNIIAKSFPLKEGDEVLTTDLEYGACDKAWNFYCSKVGAVYKRQPITLPIVSKENLVEEFFKGLTPKTKMIFISHITSSTGLRLPVEEICKKSKELGLITFVDGAHAPGQVSIDLQNLHADIYTGACHKWLMTPKGSSFLYVKKEWQHLFEPLLISWGFDAQPPFKSHSQYLDYHQLQGTRDFSAFLTIPTAINFMVENNWELVAAKCRHLNEMNIRHISDILHTQPLAPVNDEFYVQLCSTPIKTKEPMYLQRLLFEKYRIEVPVMKHGSQAMIRYSIQAYNTQEDIDKLAGALMEIMRTTDLIER